VKKQASQTSKARDKSAVGFLSKQDQLASYLLLASCVQLASYLTEGEIKKVLRSKQEIEAKPNASPFAPSCYASQISKR
jgi:hypothetical protein